MGARLAVITHGIAMLGLALGGGSARADAVGVVTVPAAAAPETTTAVEAALDDALGDAARPRALETARAAIRDGAVPAAELAAFTRVTELIDEGWQAYLEVRTDLAQTRLGEARRQAESLLPLDGGLIRYADAALRLGAALDNAGKHDEADEVLRLAAVLDPARPVTLSEFSPDVVAAWQRAQAATPAIRPVRLVVHAGDEGVSLEVDGQAAAAATLELAVGQHVVVARAAGHHALGQTFAVPAGSDLVEIPVVLEPDPVLAALTEGPAAGQSEVLAGRWLEAILTYAELDGVVVASSIWRSGRPALLVQWCDATCTAVIELGYDPGGLAAAARAAVDELDAAKSGPRIGPTLPADTRVARPEVPIIPGPRCRWCRPALYISAGVVAIAATVIAFALAAGDDRVVSIGTDPDDFVAP